MTAATEPAGAGDDLHVVFRVASTSYAVPAARVVQMETFTGATTVPGTPPWVAGLVQVRGRVVPAIDLRCRFGLPAGARTLDTRMVLVQQGARVIALVVDSARDITRVPAERIRPDPTGEPVAGGASPALVRGVASIGDRVLVLLDLDALLAQELLDGDPDDLR